MFRTVYLKQSVAEAQVCSITRKTTIALGCHGNVDMLQMLPNSYSSFLSSPLRSATDSPWLSIGLRTVL